MEFVIATHNLHKLREFKAILKPHTQLELFSLHDFPSYHLPKEEGKNFEENAISKATDAAKKTGHWVIADDSGIVVPALNGAPGLFSARYAGESATDKENRQKLLKEMEHLEDESRQAYFECWIALASPDGLQKVVSGKCEGYIADSEKGSLGFGYDPIFIKNDYNKSFAELDEDTKNRVSHRRKALDKLIPYLDMQVLA